MLLLILIAPIIYLVVSQFVDSVSNSAKKTKREKYCKEDQLLYFSTFNSQAVTKEDIMRFFASQVKQYRQRNYNIRYKIYNKITEQNYAWSIKTMKRAFGWGIIYSICFHFSNGWVCVSFSNNDFYSDGSVFLPYYLEGRDFGTKVIEVKLSICKDEAIRMWKLMKPGGSLPFDFIAFSNKTSNSQDRTKNQKDDRCDENIASADLINFYRNLLGLTTRFSHAELKKHYREAVAKYHPDYYETSSIRDRKNAEMLMKQINEAYAKLKIIAV